MSKRLVLSALAQFTAETAGRNMTKAAYAAVAAGVAAMVAAHRRPPPTRRRTIGSTRCCGHASSISCSNGWCGCATWRGKGGYRSTRFPAAGSSTRSAPLPCRSPALGHRAQDGVAAQHPLGAQGRSGHPGAAAVAPRAGAGIRAAAERARDLPDGGVSGVGRGIFPGTRRAAGDLRQRAGGAVVGGGDADHDRLWRRGADHAARPHGRGAGDDLRPRRVRAVDRYSGDRLCRRDPPRQFPEDVGDRQQGAVLCRPRPRRDRRRHPHAANDGPAGAHHDHPQGPAGRLHVFHRRRRGRGRIARQEGARSARARSSARWRCSATMCAAPMSRPPR